MLYFSILLSEKLIVNEIPCMYRKLTINISRKKRQDRNKKKLSRFPIRILDNDLYIYQESSVGTLIKCLINFWVIRKILILKRSYGMLFSKNISYALKLKNFLLNEKTINCN